TDQVFQRPTMPVFPPIKGLVARSVLEVPELRQRYRERMMQLVTNVSQIHTISNHLFAVAAKIQPVLAQVDPPAAANCLRETASLCRRVEQRLRSVQRELLSAIAAPRLDQAGVLSLGQWDSQSDIGNPLLD